MTAHFANQIWTHPRTGEERLYINGAGGRVWISRNNEFGAVAETNSSAVDFNAIYRMAGSCNIDFAAAALSDACQAAGITSNTPTVEEIREALHI